MILRNKCIGSICWYRVCLKLECCSEQFFFLFFFLTFTAFIAMDLVLGVHPGNGLYPTIVPQQSRAQAQVFMWNELHQTWPVIQFKEE